MLVLPVGSAVCCATGLPNDRGGPINKNPIIMMNLDILALYINYKQGGLKCLNEVHMATK